MAVTKINAKQIDAFSGSSATRLEVQKATTDFNNKIVTGVAQLTASEALVTADMTIQGNLTVAGDQLIANVSILEVEDLAIRAAKNAANSSQADGAGLNIGLSGTYDQSILWNHAAQRWNVSSAMSASSLKGVIDGASLGDVDTDDLAEGSTNLYFTNERVDDRVGALVVGGSGVIATYNDGAGSLTLDFDIDELTALGGTGVAQGDHFVFSDAGTEKKITFSNLEDAIFGNVSGDATLAAGGAMTIANDAITSAKIATGAVIADGIAAGAVEHGALNDNIISGQDELAHADIADADEMMISDAGVVKRVGVDSLRDHYFGVVSGDATIADGGALTIAANAVEDSMLHDNVATGLAGVGLSDASGVLALDLNELGAATVDVAADSIAIVDATDNTSKKESIADLVAGMAGTGLSAAGGQLSLAAAASENIDVSADSFRFIDATDGATKTESWADFATAIAGDGLKAASGVLAWDMNELTGAAIDVSADSFAFVDASDNSTKKESVADLMTAAAGAGLAAASGVLSVNVDGLSELDAAPHSTEDEFIVSDDGTEKRVSMANVAAGAFALVSGDATIASGGGLTIAAGAVEHGMLADNIISGQAETVHADISDADELMLSDGGVITRVGVDSLRDHFFGAVSGDATVADGGALTIAANAVQGSMLNTDVISTQAEMTGDVQDADELMISDGGTLKRIDFSVFRDSVFNDVSGDATIAAGGALTIAANAVQDGMVHDDVAAGLAGDGLSAASGVMALDLNELTGAGVAVDADSIAFIDATDNSTKKESIVDLVAAMAGPGLSASAGQLSIAAAPGAAIDVAADSFRFVDADDSNITKTESVADLMTAAAGAGVLATNGVLSVPAKKQLFDQSDFTGLNCTLSSAPQVAQSVQVFLNGQLLTEGAGNDWSISGTTLSLLDAALALDADDVLLVHWI